MAIAIDFNYIGYRMPAWTRHRAFRPGRVISVASGVPGAASLFITRDQTPMGA